MKQFIKVGSHLVHPFLNLPNHFLNHHHLLLLHRSRFLCLEFLDSHTDLFRAFRTGYDFEQVRGRESFVLPARPCVFLDALSIFSRVAPTCLGHPLHGEYRGTFFIRTPAAPFLCLDLWVNGRRVLLNTIVFQLITLSITCLESRTDLFRAFPTCRVGAYSAPISIKFNRFLKLIFTETSHF